MLQWEPYISTDGWTDGRGRQTDEQMGGLNMEPLCLHTRRVEWMDKGEGGGTAGWKDWSQDKQIAWCIGGLTWSSMCQDHLLSNLQTSLVFSCASQGTRTPLPPLTDNTVIRAGMVARYLPHGCFIQRLTPGRIYWFLRRKIQFNFFQIILMIEIT